MNLYDMNSVQGRLNTKGGYRETLNHKNFIFPESAPNAYFIGNIQEYSDNVALYSVDLYLEELCTLFELEANDFAFTGRAEIDRKTELRPYLSGKADNSGNDVFASLTSGSASSLTSIRDHDYLFRETMRYYCHILKPFSTRIEKTIKSRLTVQLPHEILTTDYCTNWKEETLRILDQFRQWIEKKEKGGAFNFYYQQW